MAPTLRYLALDLVVMLIVWLILRKHVILNTHVLVVLGFLLLLTAVFDNVIIACHIVAYNWQHTLGVRIGYAPVEDFFYPLVGTFTLIGIWEGYRARTTK